MCTCTCTCTCACGLICGASGLTPVTYVLTTNFTIKHTLTHSPSTLDTLSHISIYNVLYFYFLPQERFLELLLRSHLSRSSRGTLSDVDSFLPLFPSDTRSGFPPFFQPLLLAFPSIISFVFLSSMRLFIVLACLTFIGHHCWLSIDLLLNYLEGRVLLLWSHFC